MDLEMNTNYEKDSAQRCGNGVDSSFTKSPISELLDKQIFFNTPS